MRQVSLLFVAAFAFVPCRTWAQGEPVGAEFRVNTYTTDYQFRSAVAAASSGDFVVVWTSNGQDGSSFGVFGQRYAGSGVPLGPEFRVNSYTTNIQARQSVAADSSGNFVVVWTSAQDGSLYGVFGQRFASSGAPLGPEFRVNTYTTNSQTGPSVASDAAGDFVVVWESDQDGSSYGVFGQRFAASGNPVGPEFRINTYTTGNQSGPPSVAVDGSGNIVVVWVSNGQDGSIDGVFGQRYQSSGAPLGPEFRVNTYTTGYQFTPVVSADGAGSFVVVWAGDGQDGSLYGVFGQRYQGSGAPLGPEFRVNTFTTGYEVSPSVAKDGAGDFVVAWQGSAQDGSAYGVFAQRYAASGSPLGPEFRVNSYTASYQVAASAAVDGSGGFVVAWHSAGQDGSSGGIFAQRFGPIVPVELMRFGVE